jgi:very-short-patch-repair endonuclease
MIRGRQAAERKLTSPSPLAGEGRGGGSLLANARELRKNQTPPERKLWSALRNKSIDGLHFRHQATIGHCIVDFVCHQAQLVIEVDGITHVGEPKDKVRDKWLRSCGYTVLHFWNNEVMGNLEGVLEIIRANASGHPPPRPSPARGEGDSP